MLSSLLDQQKESISKVVAQGQDDLRAELAEVKRRASKRTFSNADIEAQYKLCDAVERLAGGSHACGRVMKSLKALMIEWDERPHKFDDAFRALQVAVQADVPEELVEDFVQPFKRFKRTYANAKGEDDNNKNKNMRKTKRPEKKGKG